MYYFNPWEAKCKWPFGAVKLYEDVSFAFSSDQDVSIKLVIHRDFGSRHEFDLARVDDRTFSTTIQFDKGAALYFYHFEIIENTDWGGRRLYYGRSALGGEGLAVENEHDVTNFQLTVIEKEDPTPAWYRDAVFYQIFPDRFNSGKPDGQVLAPKPNSFIYGAKTDDPFYIKDETGDIARWDFYGGNLEGIIAKIPYLKQLGVTAIYLNPVFLARSNHRYDTSDYLQIDPMLGTEADFRALIEALHAEGMHIILDGVFSHVGQDSRYFNIFGKFGPDEGAAKNINSPYFDWFKFNNYPYDYKSWWGIKDLPEVDKDNQSFRDFIYGAYDSVLAKWETFGVDGWRLDVADELPDSFIRGIRARLNTYEDQVLIGEVWEDASNKISYGKRRDYILGDSLQGVMNYPFRDLIIRYATEQIDAKNVAYALMTLRDNYPRDVFYGNLNNIGTHDSERILSMVGDEHMEIAVGMMFMLPGVPCIYYGDEAGLTGLKDPANRKYFPWENIYAPIYEVYRHWSHERLASQALRTGDMKLGFVDNVLVIVRLEGDETIVYLTNPNRHEITVDFSRIQFLQEFSKAAEIKAYEKQKIEASNDLMVKL